MRELLRRRLAALDQRGAPSALPETCYQIIERGKAPVGNATLTNKRRNRRITLCRPVIAVEQIVQLTVIVDDRR